MTTHSPSPWEMRCSYNPVTGKIRGLYLIDSKCQDVCPRDLHGRRTRKRTRKIPAS